MAWVFSVNHFVSGTSKGGWTATETFKSVIKSAGWTIRMSRGYVPSPPALIPYFVDNPTGDYVDIDPLARFEAFCYFVAQQPVATGHPRREFLFYGSGPLSTTVDVFVSPSGGFVWRPDNPVNRPADTRQIAGAACSTHGLALFPDDSFVPAGNFYYHAGADGAAPWGWYLRWTTTVDVVPRGIVFDPFVTGTFNALDQDPAVYNCSEDSTYGSPFTTALYASGSASAKYWWRKGFANETWCSYFNGQRSGLALAYDIGAYGVVIPSTGLGVGPNPHSSKCEHFPIAWGRGPSFRTHVGWKGIGTVQRWQASNLSDFDTLSISGVRERVVVRAVTLPWPDVAPSY